MHSQSVASTDPTVHANEHRRSCTRHALCLYEQSDSQRRRIESFIQLAFAKHHGATVRSFMPTLLALEGHDRRICGVAGFRSAATEPLFLEKYLTQPIQHELYMRTGKVIERHEIVEVGNLASLSCRAAFHLVTALPRLLTERGHRWIAFTATSAVRGILDKFNAPTIELATASRDRVAGLADDWGRYYENDPRVMAGYLPDGLDLNLARVEH